VKRRVVWSRDALDELKQIAAFIASDDPLAARSIAANIRKTGEKLGALATGRRGRVGGTYEKPVPRLPYIMAYALAPLPGGGEAVVILRVIHGARNWPDEDWPRT
jgi:toxin ParE1/3/4